jgi:Ca2+-binding EF-hand superfamily protein
MAVFASTTQADWETDKGVFFKWIKEATTDHKSKAYGELYQFLSVCFQEADTDLDGLIGAEEFDYIVERAAALPRKFGFAPAWHEQYASIPERQASRVAHFAKMDESKRGKITLNEWVQFTVKHIFGKLGTKEFKEASTTNFQNMTAEGFKAFLTRACADRTSSPYKELYLFLFECFIDADKDMDGCITFEEFDGLIEIAGAAPRKHGLAPPTDSLYPNPEARIAARTKMFKDMDADGNGTIGLEEWIDFSMKHINGKVNPKKTWQNDKATFCVWIKEATANHSSTAHAELYKFLATAFQEADSDLDGLVGPLEFDFMVERAAALPRKFGFAPPWQEQFATVQERQTSRAAHFAKMDEDNSGKISLSEWVQFTVNHIFGKIGTKVFQEADAVSFQEKSAEGFKEFLKAACASQSSAQYKELYLFLFECFVNGDKDKDGCVNFDEFDALIEIAGAAPRKHGLAPPTDSMYPNPEARIAARTKMFKEMDTDGNGTIGLEEWIDFSMKHIKGKVTAS